LLQADKNRIASMIIVKVDFIAFASG